MNKRFFIVAAMIFVASFSRILTNYLSVNGVGFFWNFTPIGAMALFAGANFKNKSFSFLVPIVAMLLTDFTLGFMHGLSGFYSQMIYIYGAFAVITFIGIWLSNRQSFLNIVFASIASSIIFFLVTNFAVWPGNILYPQNFTGLMDSYIAGVPFFGNTVVGDLFFCGVLFGGYALVKAKVPSLEESLATAK